MNNVSLTIHKIVPSDYDAVWDIFSDIVSTGDTYAFSPDISKEKALDLWIKKTKQTYVAKFGKEIVGTYYIKPNQPDLGSHVCNCGYMVSQKARGRGIATVMCQHSQQQAQEMGFLGMQFNLVVATNKGAVKLWEKLNFKIVGTIPKAFNHKELGFVDAHIMYKWL